MVLPSTVASVGLGHAELSSTSLEAGLKTRFWREAEVSPGAGRFPERSAVEMARTEGLQGSQRKQTGPCHQFMGKTRHRGHLGCPVPSSASKPGVVSRKERRTLPFWPGHKRGLQRTNGYALTSCHSNPPVFSSLRPSGKKTILEYFTLDSA